MLIEKPISTKPETEKELEIKPGSVISADEQEGERLDEIISNLLDRLLTDEEITPASAEAQPNTVTVAPAVADTVTVERPEVVSDPELSYATTVVAEEAPTRASPVGPAKVAPKPEPILLERAESGSALMLVFLAAIPILLVAAALRLWDWSPQSPFMDETIYIVTGRMLNEQGLIYSNALQWTFGSLLYPTLVGYLDSQGGLALARGLSLLSGLVLVGSVIFFTLGLFKAMPDSREKARADFALSSKPVIAALMAGLVVAILPNAIALSRYATYDAMAAGLFALGCAFLVWAIREARLASYAEVKRPIAICLLFFLAAACFFTAFLTKYIVALFFPLLCLLVLMLGATRLKGFISFVLPLIAACVIYYLSFNNDLNALLRFATQFKDLQSDDWFRLYVIDRFDLVLLMLFGYWGFRQTVRDGRAGQGFILIVGAAITLGFQLITRADHDYWKHSIYIVLLAAPLVGWLWADWTWWDEPVAVHSPGIRKWWANYKRKRLAAGGSKASLTFIERTIGGNELTERDGCSYSLLAVLATLLVLIGAFWSVESAKAQLGRWPSYTPGLAQIQQYSQEAIPRQGNQPQSTNILTDDNAVLYYLYGTLPLERVTDPFYINYQGQTGPEAYAQAVRDKQFGLVILNGGATYKGQKVWQTVHPVLTQENSLYQLVYSQPLDQNYLEGPHTLEIYRLMTPEEQKQAKAQPKVAPKPVVAPAPTVAAVPTASGPGATATAVAAKSAPTAATPTVASPSPTAKAGATVSVTAAPAQAQTPAATGRYPAHPAYDFANGDEGWGLLPQVGELQPGSAVAASDTYKLDNHPSLKFTPQIATKGYTVGVNKTGKVRKISLYVFVPADKAGGEVRVGMYYFDKKWNWKDDGFQTKVVPGQWTQLQLELTDPLEIQQFGLKIVGFSGAVYINGVSIIE